MRQTFWAYYSHQSRGHSIVDRRTGMEIAECVPDAYIHHLMDLLNADAEARRVSTARELLRAFE